MRFKPRSESVAAEGVELGVGRRPALAHERAEQGNAAPRGRGDLAAEVRVGEAPEARDRLTEGPDEVLGDHDVLDPVGHACDQAPNRLIL